MEWKNGTLRSMLKGNKEKVIFLFCSGLLLFVISLPNGKTTDSGLRAGTVEVIADVSGDDESTASEDAGAEAAAKAEAPAELGAGAEIRTEAQAVGAADPGTIKECGWRRGGGCDGGVEIFGGEDLACG